MVEGTGLENRRPFTWTASSNLAPSANICINASVFFCLVVSVCCDANGLAICHQSTEGSSLWFTIRPISGRMIVEESLVCRRRFIIE